MPTAPDTAHLHDFQLGMVNPPRRVKRLRELVLKDTPSSVAAGGPLVSSSSSQQDPTPQPSTTVPRRRGRKPAGPLSKSAREQLRKTNHSVIEKRRREKINEALATLRDLIPNDKHDGEKEDKEFKLEILVRTVEYLQIMVDKVKNLEDALCQKCGGHLLGAPAVSTAAPVDDRLPRLVKRKRVEYEAETPAEIFGDEKEDLAAVLLTGPAQGAPPASKVLTEPQPQARLPSISSWMNESTVGGPQLTPHTYQLPSPPQTAPFAPITIASTGFPPKLVLPSPIGPNPPSIRNRSSAHQGSPSLERTSPSFTSRSPCDRDVPELPLDTPLRSLPEHTFDLGNNALSPPLPFHRDRSPTLPRITTSRRAPSDRQGGSPDSPWSRDDQTAASLLLNISSRHSRSGSDEEIVQNRDLKSMIGGTSSRRGVGLSAQTPSSLLGMAEDSGSESSAF